MKKLKKLVAAMLCLVTVLCTTATAFAAEAHPESVTASDPVVAEVTIFSSTGNDDSFINLNGHAFISVKNISSSTITVGKMNVGPGLEITLGTRGNAEQHTGMWYNVESYKINKLGSYPGRASLTTKITQSDLNLLNVAIVYTNGWSIGAPCSSAAVKLWNTVSDIKLSDGTPSTPTSLRNSIMSKTGYQLNRPVQYTTPIGYVNLAGKFVSLEYSDIIWKSSLSSISIPEE